MLGKNVFPKRISRSFSKGVKFKSKDKTLLLLLHHFRTGMLWITGEMSSDGSTVMLDLCRLMWPPKACPVPKLWPHIVHSWAWVPSLVRYCFTTFWSTVSFGFLWLARWPPRAWNEENLLLHVLHSNRLLVSRSVYWFTSTCLTMEVCDNIIRHLAMSSDILMDSSNSDLSLFILFWVGKLFRIRKQKYIFVC